VSEKVPPRSRSRAAPFKPQASEVDKPYETDASQIAPPEPGPTISRGPALLDLKIHWAAMSASQKLRAKQAGLAATVAVLGYGLYTASGSSSADQPVIPAASKLDMGAGLRGDSLETKLRGDVRKILDGQTLLGDRITAIEEGKVLTYDGDLSS
jgi:conjugal transfer pilus assembly protein TraB